LSPAFDMTYSFNPDGRWTATHQMTVNGKRENFTLEDFRSCANVALLKRGQEKTILTEVQDVVSQWPRYARDAGIPKPTREKIHKLLRLDRFE